MRSLSEIPFPDLIAQARGGNDAAMGWILRRYEDYLKLLARLQIGTRLQAKVSESDIVQDAFLEAQKHIAAFRGATEPELRVWLRRILATQIAQAIRYHHRDRRDIGLERRVADDLDRSAAGLAALLDKGTSPSGRAARNEDELLLANALAQVKPEHREVIILRNLEELSFEDVGQRMGRNADAVKSLWVRALASLRRALLHVDESFAAAAQKLKA